MTDKQDRVVYTYSSDGQERSDLEGDGTPNTTPPPASTAAGMASGASSRMAGTSSSSDNDAGTTSSDPEQIRDNIEATRANMSQTIDEIQNRLSPSTIKQQAVDRAKATAQQAKDTAMQKAADLTNAAGPTVQQARAKVQQSVATAKDKLQNETSPQTWGIIAAVLGGLVALVLLVRRVRGGGEEEDEDEGVLEVVELATGRAFKLVPLDEDDD